MGLPLGAPWWVYVQQFAVTGAALGYTLRRLVLQRRAQRAVHNMGPALAAVSARMPGLWASRDPSGSPALRGSVSNRKVRIDVEWLLRRSGPFFRVVVAAAYRGPIGYMRQRSGFPAPVPFSGRGKQFRSGDARFDQAFIVKGGSTAALAQLLGPSCRAQLVDAAANAPAFVVEGGEVVVELTSAIADPGALEALIRWLLATAHLLEAGAH